MDRKGVFCPLRAPSGRRVFCFTPARESASPCPRRALPGAPSVVEGRSRCPSSLVGHPGVLPLAVSDRADRSGLRRFSHFLPAGRREGKGRGRGFQLSLPARAPTPGRITKRAAGEGFYPVLRSLISHTGLPWAVSDRAGRSGLRRFSHFLPAGRREGKGRARGSNFHFLPGHRLLAA
ncbi:unnamed protein product [Calypogeia fissa]